MTVIYINGVVKNIIYGRNLNASTKLNRSHDISRNVQFARQKQIGMSTCSDIGINRSFEV